MTDRAVSVTLDYIILLMIATVLLAGVVTVSATLIDDQVDRGMDGELSATGETLAADIQDVERLVNTTNVSSTELELESTLPRLASGEGYTIAVAEGGEALRLEARERDISVRTPVASDRLQATDGSLRGGPVRIVVTDGSIEVIEA